MREKLARLVAVATGVLIIVAVMLFGVLQQRMMVRIGAELDPAAWTATYPRHVASFMRMAVDSGPPEDKLASKPFRRRAWAGHPFELEYNGTRGHYYAQIDQRNSRRTRERDQPAGCINCHAAEAPALIAAVGWHALHRMRYDDIRDRLHVGMSCVDCHAPDTMALRITRPAFAEAMRSQGIDVTTASVQDMRSYVCAQCHVEYYFTETGQELVLPWTHGRKVEDIEWHYDDIGFSDWTHTETGAALIKIQHPDFELYGAGVHAAAGAACADCHMPSIQEGGLAISDHWMRSPLQQLGAACGSCHRRSEGDLREQVLAIQARTAELSSVLEATLAELMNAIVAARAAGASDIELAGPRRAQRRAQLRWDFIDAENSTGFHAPGEAQRILTDGLVIARGGLRAVIAEDRRQAE